MKEGRQGGQIHEKKGKGGSEEQSWVKKKGESTKGRKNGMKAKQ